MSGITDKINADEFQNVKNLFNEIKENSEFEFILFSKKNIKNLSLKKYIDILKFLTKRASIDKTKKFVGEQIMLDVIYNFDNESVYRCTVNDKTNIDKNMRKFSEAKNHIIFRNFVKLASKKENNIELMKKVKSSGKTIDIDDLYMRIRLSDELPVSEQEKKELLSINNEEADKIIYRLKERSSFYIIDDTNTKLKIDLTTTKTNSQYYRLNQSVPKYELEIELVTDKKKEEYLTVMFVETELLLKVIQNSNFIITNSESKNIIDMYRELLSAPRSITKLYGRNPVSLEIIHVEQLPNKYAVTDKADGERHFLCIFNNKVYLINNNLDVRTTGIELNEKNRHFNNTIIDGELLFIKNRHVFLAFDCLYNSGIDIRKIESLKERIKNVDNIIENCFIFKNQKGFIYKDLQLKEFDLEKTTDFYREQMKIMVSNLNNDIEVEKKYLLVRRKYFIHSIGAKPWEIFKYSTIIWDLYSNSDIKYPYKLDGLIYQPNNEAYITDKKSSKYSDYKWKPPNVNSLDFYIEFLKDSNGNIPSYYDNSYGDISNEDFDNAGQSGNRVKNITYKICKLYIGQLVGNKETPELFKQSEDLHEAYLCLNNGAVRDIEGNIIMDKTVVEFYYDTNPNLPNKFRWIPLRTRYDKTESVMRFGSQYGNFFGTANGIWKSIITPLLMSDFEELSKGNVQKNNDYTYDDKLKQLRDKVNMQDSSSLRAESYFQKNTKISENMRNFHHFIKDNLYGMFCHYMYNNEIKKSVLDIGVGRGADLMKFYHTKTKFLVGIDVDKIALEYPGDGAVSRYETHKKSKPGFPEMYFIHADFNSKLDYESQYNALGGMNRYYKEIFDKFFSHDPKKRTKFDIINAGFSLHYGLKDETTFENLKKNINDYLKDGGYLIVTTFDGAAVRKLLDNKQKYTQEYVDEDGSVQVLFEITKKYGNIPNDEIMGVGNRIDVYMSWLQNEGTSHPEYIIDSRFLISEFKNYCNLDLVSSDTFENQYENNRDFFMHYFNFEADDRTKNNFIKRKEYYNKTSINDASKVYTNLEMFYVFRKRERQFIPQKGGKIDGKKYHVSKMLDYSDNNYSFVNSIHHILRNHNLIPNTLTPNDFYSDLNIPYMKNKDLNDNEKNMDKILKNIIIKHEQDGKVTKVLNGLSLILVLTDCNNDMIYQKIGSCSKKKSYKTIILINRDDSYYPLFIIDQQNGEFYGVIYCKDNELKKFLDNLDDLE